MLGDAIRGRQNNFDLMRAVAAILVILSHSYALLGNGFDPGGWLTGAYLASTVAVHGFFLISGFLISKSWCDRPQFHVYAIKRLARIDPAYALVLLVSALILGPLTTTLPLREYFRSPATRGYVVNNLLFYQIHYALPGVFGDLPVPNAVNGSIWSLPVEMYMYILVPILAAFGGILGTRGRPSILFLAAVLLAADWHFFSRPENASLVVFHLLVRVSLQCAFFFAVGACFYVYRESVPLNGTLAAMAAGLLVGSWRTPYAQVFEFLCLPYLVFAIAFVPTQIGQRFSRWGDPSYGLYVYAFPIQQTIIFLWRGIEPLALFALTVAVATPMSYLSWRYFEKPILDFVRDRLRGKQAEAAPERRLKAA